MPLTLNYSSYAEAPTYIPQSDLNELSDDNLNTATAVQNTIEQALFDSESLVDGYLSQEIDVPAKASDGTVPGIVKQWTYAVARYFLLRRRNAAREEAQKDYDKVISELEKAAKGEIKIILKTSAGVDETPLESLLYDTMDEDNFLFTDTKMVGVL